MNSSERAIKFIENLFQVYLEKRDIKKMASMLDDDISWFGTGANELCHNIKGARALLDSEIKSWSGRFKILNQWSKAISLEGNFCAVYGEIEMIEDKSTNEILVAVKGRFSAICKINGDDISLYHVHFSFPNDAQAQGEFIHKKMIDDYNDMLKKKLDEATSNLESAVDRLRIKNLELEVIYENVDFGIIERTYDEKTGVITELVNQKALSIFGMTKERYDEIRSKGEYSFTLSGVSSEDAIKSITDIDSDTPVRTKLKVCREDGQEIWIAIYALKLDETNDKITTLFTVQDVTEEEDYKRILAKKNEELLLSEKLYEIAMNHTETIVFDYDILSKRMVQSHNTMERYGFPSVIEDPINTIVASGAIHENCVQDFKEAYEKIHRGEPSSKVRLTVVDKYGKHSYSEISLTTIYDIDGVPIRAVGVLTDISEITRLENERQYKDSLVADKVLIYEADITRNIIEYVSPEWLNMFNAPVLNTYDDLVNYACINIIFGEDIDNYRMIASRESIIESVNNNKFYQTVEYRRCINPNSYTWVQGMFNIIRDELTGDIKVRCYINPIDNAKKKELEILYKSEHDALTELFNRGALNQRIKSYLDGDGKNGKHAFLLFDIDMFKQINDNFGHSFGDAVLSQVSRKIKTLFRDDDILGRIGGDEFVVLMKNVPNQKMALKKARELCAVVMESYTQNGKKYVISASVGIAMYKEHGMSYQKLYDRSDAAMYAAKKSGRNNAMMYDRNMEENSTDARENMLDDVVESKSFEKNIAEYIFKILYESHDKISAINSVLELVGKQYQASRAYIFEKSDNTLKLSNTFEWCNSGVEEQKDTLQNMSYSDIGNYEANFNKDGVFYLLDVDEAPKSIRAILKRQDIRSTIQFAIVKNGTFEGFVGFDQCGFARSVGQDELEELKVIANILGVFLVEMRVIDTNEMMKNMALSIVNGLDSYAYVIRPDTYELLFINEKTKIISPASKIGEACYKAFWNNEEPCEKCPIEGLKKSGRSSNTLVLYNPKFNVTTKATASWIDWSDGLKMCLLDCVDITDYVGDKYKPEIFIV